MKETRCIVDPKMPYGLHDSKIDEIKITNGNLELYFKDKITKIGKDISLKVRGNIIVEGIDSDFCCVLINDNEDSNGNFYGKKFEISEFIDNYKDYTFEVIDEYYGYHRLEYQGYLWTKNEEPKEMTLCLGYFKGDIIYRTEE